MTEEQQKKALELKHMTNGVTGEESSAKEANGTNGAACCPAPAGGCCQGNGGGFTCCQSDQPEEKQDKSVPAEENHKSSTAETDKESGKQEALAGTVGFHQRHVFLCYKSPAEWPSHVEATDSDRLPRILAAAIKARKSNLNKSVSIPTPSHTPFSFRLLIALFRAAMRFWYASGTAIFSLVGGREQELCLSLAFYWLLALD
jgi:hypothetical protein